MPLYMRRVEPVNVGRRCGVKQDGTTSTRSELVVSQEEAANRSLANIVRQLAGLGAHADEIFSTLEEEARGVGDRAGALALRIARVTERLEVCVGHGQHHLKKTPTGCQKSPTYFRFF